MTYPCAVCTGSAIAAASWNGGVCATCGARYLGSHTCSSDDILRRVKELLALLPGIPANVCRAEAWDEGYRVGQSAAAGTYGDGVEVPRNPHQS